MPPALRPNPRDEDIIQDMRIAAAACPRGALTLHRYNKLGRYGAMAVRGRFGSWTAAMWRALPEVMERRHPTPAQMIADLHRVADICREAIAANSDNDVRYHAVKVRNLSANFYSRRGLYGHRYLLIHLAPHLQVKTWTEIKLAVGIDDV